jgi:oligopeptide/dipeptide ABC transporter ATP-binding protein
MYDVRGKEISMVFQEPMTSLNPLFTIGNQLTETICLHQKMSKKEALEQAIEMLRLVGIPLPAHRMRQYPFELSGGMRQRVMIAIALSCNPNILIADEPTTALDVTIQAQILELINRLNDDLGTSLILITHDLGVIAETVETVMVMYAGHLVELSGVNELFHKPLHPYTEGLLNAMPKISLQRDKLKTIPGTIPGVDELSSGCRFFPRCSKRMEICCKECPPTSQIKDRLVKCWFYAEGGNINNVS